MENKTRTFIELFNSTFSEDKIKNDFKSYLYEDFDKVDSFFTVSVYNEDTNISKNVIITVDDLITIISHKCILEFNSDITFIVKISIGHFIEDSFHKSFFQTEKCLANLKYNYKLEIMDVDFIINEINKMS